MNEISNFHEYVRLRDVYQENVSLVTSVLTLNIIHLLVSKIN